MKAFLILTIILSILPLNSCDKNEQESFEKFLDLSVPISSWNTQIKLIDNPILSNTHKNGEILTLQLKNLSNATIVFPDDFGIKIIRWNGQTWANISNNFYYSGLKRLPTENSYPLGLLVSSLPYVPNITSPVEVRILVIGHAEGNDEELLGAYFDVKLNP